MCNAICPAILQMVRRYKLCMHVHMNFVRIIANSVHQICTRASVRPFMHRSSLNNPELHSLITKHAVFKPAFYMVIKIESRSYNCKPNINHIISILQL
jgi:hypothetical protein